MEINGIEYRRKEVIKSGGRNLGKIMAMTEIMGMFKRQKELNINLVDEFKLIQEKKSKLSRSDRDLVVSQFNRFYEKVT